MSNAFTQEDRGAKLGGFSGGKKPRQRSGAVAAALAAPAAPAPEMPPLPQPPAPSPPEDKQEEHAEQSQETHPEPAKAQVTAKAPPLPLPGLPPLEAPEDEFELDEVDLPQQINVYVLPEAARRARALCRAEGLEHADVAMQAIDAALKEDVLGLLVQARRTDKQPAGSAFPARRRARPKAKRGVRRVVWPCQFADGQIAVLEELIAKTGAAGGYSELISVAVEAHLLD